MRVELFYDEGLGNGSYLLEIAAGKAILIDPDRRTSRYLRRADDLGVEIVAVLDTHLHADFVDGSTSSERSPSGAVAEESPFAGVNIST